MTNDHRCAHQRRGIISYMLLAIYLIVIVLHIVSGTVRENRNIGRFTCVSFQGRGLVDCVIAVKGMFHL